MAEYAQLVPHIDAALTSGSGLYDASVWPAEVAVQVAAVVARALCPQDSNRYKSADAFYEVLDAIR